MKDLLVECFPLFRNDDKIFTGYDEEKEKSVIGRYNLGKVNPMEPDLRLYYSGEDKDFLSLWLKTSGSGRPYLIGNRNGSSYVGLINLNRLEASDPYLTIYIVIKLNKECKN